MAPRAPPWGPGEGGTDWGGDTSGYYTKTQKIIQSPETLYKALTDYIYIYIYKAPQKLYKDPTY